MLNLHFERVDVFTDEILAANPRSMWHYASAWRLLDRFQREVVLMKTFIPVDAVAFVTGFVSGFALFAWACLTSVKP